MSTPSTDNIRREANVSLRLSLRLSWVTPLAPLTVWGFFPTTIESGDVSGIFTAGGSVVVGGGFDRGVLSIAGVSFLLVELTLEELGDLLAI